MISQRWSRRLLIALLGLAILVSGCADPAPGVDEGADPALDRGRTVWVNGCASCHAANGSGGRGPALDQGRVLARFPEVEDQIELVSEGRGAMPGFAGRLSESDIEAVVRYTREVLTVAE